jgi:ABC-2 type transport system ATP-binding protein
VLQSLEAHGIRVASVTVSRPSLDDVYLRTTGRSFTEADREDESAGSRGRERKEVHA